MTEVEAYVSRAVGPVTPAPDAIISHFEELTEAVARVCDRPQENVHLQYLPPGVGRVAFGGQLVRS